MERYLRDQGTTYKGTNVSEGRGTTKPFELIGAPWMRAEAVIDLARQRLNHSGLGGVMLREANFIPTFSKYQGERCQGFQLHLTDRHKLCPFKVGLILLRTVSDLHRKSFEWLHTEDRYFFDFLTGTDKFRKLIKARSALGELLDLAQEGLSDFDITRRRYLLYP